MSNCLPPTVPSDRLLPKQGRTLVERLQNEWRVLAHRPAVVRRAAAWGLDVAFDDLDELIAATGYWASPQARAAAAAHGEAGVDRNASGNELVAKLVTIARTDDLAARVVLQRLLPGLIGAARRWPRWRAGGADQPFDEIVAAAWAVIREYPVERRPQHLVANLLRASEYHAFIRAGRRLIVHEPTEPSLLDRPAAPGVRAEPLDELAEVVACVPSLTARERRLLALLLSGRSTVEVAAVLEVSERTVRSHREAMVNRLRAAVLAA